MQVVIIIIIIFVFASVLLRLKHNEDLRRANTESGGLRKSFLKFTNHLETIWGMVMDTDTGRRFSYSMTQKTDVDTRKIIIGIKLDIQNQPVLFSKLISNNHGKFDGLDIIGVDFDSSESINKCIAKSLDQIDSFQLPEKELNSSKPDINSIKLKLERKFLEIVIRSYNNNPLKGSPLEGVGIYTEIANATEEAKISLGKQRFQLGLTKEEVDEIVDEISGNVIEKYLKF